jgi:Zn-finger nucleic acid-binding protein
MNCPHDRTPLLPHKRDGVAAHSCLQCHGVWFARDAVRSLTQTTPPSNAPGFVLRRLPCPACAHDQLQTRLQNGIETNRCPACGGLWLAKADVEKLLAASRPRATSAASSASPVTPRTSADLTADVADGLIIGGETLAAEGVFAELLATLL